MPIKYVNSKKIKVCENLTFRINYLPSKNVLKSKSHKIRHDVDAELMASMFSSTVSEEDDTMSVASSALSGGAKWNIAPYYLILSIPEYKSTLDDFSEWKKFMGFNTRIVYSSEWTPANIKNQIKSMYDSIPSLQYVLLVGDALSLPPVRHLKDCYYSFDHSSDYSYGCMDGDDDMEQDIIIGRINVSNTKELSVVINKIIAYEKNPPTSSSFYGNSLHAAYFQDDHRDKYEDRRFTRTSEDIRSGLQNEDFEIKRVYATNSPDPSYWNNDLFAYGEPLPEDLKKESFNWIGKSYDIKQAIDSGTFYIFHRGHGNYDGWSRPSYSTEDILSLSNGSLMPVCFSINCQTGAFGGSKVYNSYTKSYEIIELSFAEAIMRKSNGGAVGVIAATETSYSGPNDVLAMEMFQAIWPKSNILTDFPHYDSNGINHSATPYLCSR